MTSDPVTNAYTLYCTNPSNPNAMLGDVEASRNSSGHYYFEARLNWERQFGLHNVSFMTVAIAEEKVLTAGNSSDIFETLPERNLGNSGRLAYGYDDRYFIEFDYGYNGSEKFASKHRFGFFPSIGGGWMISNEKFWAKMKNAISLLKLRFTYGLVGNDAIAGRSGRFQFLSRINLNSGGRWNTINFGKNFDNKHNGYTISQYANPEVGWEVSKKLDAGLEINLFKNEAVKIQADYFHENRDRIYMTRSSLPYTAGFSGVTIAGNTGKAESYGMEFSVDVKHFFNNDFWITSRTNFTYATNKYIELDEPDYHDRYRSKVGHNINQPWGYVAERLFADQAEIDYSPTQGSLYMPGDIKYTDINGDGVIGVEDQIAIGYPTVPEIQYGFGASLGYKRWDFSFFCQGNARVSFFISPGAIAPFVGRGNALKIIADDYWSETDPDVHAFWPRLSTVDVGNNTMQSTWWLRDGSFMRLKSMEIGYNLPVEKYHIANARLYLSGENLFHFSPFKMWDPEVGSNGLGYPINRRFNLGLQLSF
jgi:TonB-linked SusC/RagA family outer membrane protein